MFIKCLKKCILGFIKLYRRFYKLTSISGSNNYDLLNPVKITAKTFIKNSTNEIENLPLVSKESNGIFFVSLNPKLYQSRNIYDLYWYVQYIKNAPQKRLITSFQVIPYNISANIDIELEKQDINCQVDNLEQEINYKIKDENYKIIILEDKNEFTNI